MPIYTLTVASLLAVMPGALPAVTQGPPSEELRPSVVMNSVYGEGNLVVVYAEDPAIERYAKACRRQFFAKAQLMASREAAKADLAGRTLIVYGTTQNNAWLARYRDRLPFRYDRRGVQVQDQHFEGDALRLMSAVRNPQDPERHAVLYTAKAASNVVGIHDVFHGPTEWLVADGARTLAAARYRRLRELTPEEMKADLDYLATTIRATHVAALDGLPTSVEAALREAGKGARRPQSPAEFWFTANRVLLALDDAHSSLGSWPNGPSIDLPFDWLSDGLIVTADAGRLRRGDKILSIGGKNEAELLASLRSLIPAETDAWIRYRGSEALTRIAVLEGLKIIRRSPVRVVYEREGKKRTIELERSESSTSTSPPPWVRWKLDPEHDLAIFTLDRCRIDDHYRKTVREFFTAVHAQKIGRIAIDVRANSGGNSLVIDEFLRYYDLDRYRGFSSEVRETEESLRQRGRKGGKTGFTRHGPQVRTNRRVENFPSWTGQTYVLTSKRTFSGGNWFAVIFQDNDLGEVIGEPTGNAPSSYGDILSFELPRSEFPFFVSYKRWIRPDPTRDPATNVVPDRVILQRREHVIRGVDPVLESLRKD